MSKINTLKPFQLPELNGVDVYEITVAQLQDHCTGQKLTSAEYVKSCLNAIQRTNSHLASTIEVNPDALTIAETLDTERRDGKIRGPLHGVPVLLKDNQASADRMQTTAASLALVGSRPTRDSHLVHLLRGAGAVLIGKANMDEWAGTRSSVLSTGYSARGGQCRNPYDLSRTPGGSSSGSAAAVAANLVPIAIGTETDGSIIAPAMACGLVGIKPTVGLTSRSGVIPISSTQDSIGPLARTVADAAALLDVIAGPDPNDTFTLAPEAKREKSYAAFLSNKTALKGARFGLPRQRFWNLAPAPQRLLAERVLKLITSAGAKIYDVDMPCATERISEDGEWDWLRYGTTHPDRAEITVMKVQAYNGINAYLAGLTNTKMKTVEDLVRFNIENNELEGGIAGTHPAFASGQDLFEAACATQGVEDDTYKAALKHIQSQARENGIDAVLKHHDAASGETFELDGLLFCDIKFAGVTIAAQAGYPIITVPIGVDAEGMPVGISVQHTAWEEGRLIHWASAIEDLIKDHDGLGRVPPSFKNWEAGNIPVAPTWKYDGAPGWDDFGGGTTTGRDAQVIEQNVERNEE